MLADKEFGRFEVRPITGALGDELKGVDLLAADDPTFEDVRKALYKHKVLAVRGQELAPESLSRVASAPSAATPFTRGWPGSTTSCDSCASRTTPAR